MTKQLTINPDNRRYYSEDFTKGFECGTRRQFEAGKADRPQGEWKINNNGWAYCSKCGRLGLESYDFCPYCGARMFAKDTNVPNKKGADDE